MYFMKLNHFPKQLLIAKRWVATSLLCLFVTIFAWQGVFFANATANATAIASPSTNLVAAADLGDKVQQKAGKDAERAKDFVQDTKDRVQKTAKKNATKVDQATDEDTNFIGRKARKDQGRIEAKAEKDSARTQKAIDKTENVVKRTVDNIKDAFSD
jgi:geranylgeranyl pyrophosphate synthase